MRPHRFVVATYLALGAINFVRERGPSRVVVGLTGLTAVLVLLGVLLVAAPAMVMGSLSVGFVSLLAWRQLQDRLPALLRID